MTRQRDFKARVRARMERTGERYSTARAQLLATRPTLSPLSVEERTPGATSTRHPFPSVKTVGGQQADVAAARNLLSSAGVRGPDATPLTEAMAFGLAGGIGFLYGVFEYDGVPTMTIVGRNQSTPDRFLEPLFENAGVEVDISTTTGAPTAQRRLDRLLDQERPVLCTVGAGYLPYLGLPQEQAAMSPHVVGVIGREGETLLLDDRSPYALPVGAPEFAAARRGYGAAKHRMVSVSSVDPDHDWSEAMTQAVRAGAEGYDTPPVPRFAANVGIAGLQKWHRLLTTSRERKSWQRVFPAGYKAAIGLSRVYDCVTHAYTAPGGGRPLYAEFLTQAAEVTGRTRWTEIADAFSRSGACWEQLATIASGVNDDLGRYAELAEQRNAALDDEPNVTAMAQMHADQRTLIRESTLTVRQATESYERLADVVAQIIDIEEEAIRELIDIHPRVPIP